MKILELIQVLFNVLILSSYGFKGCFISRTILRRFAAVVVMIIYLRVFYWLRLFTMFSLVIRVLYNTLKNITTFMILLILVILAFANASYIINSNLAEDDQSIARLDSKSIYDTEFFYSDFLDAVIRQYMVGVGDYNTSRFQSTSGDDAFIWVFFIGATFLT